MKRCARIAVLAFAVSNFSFALGAPSNDRAYTISPDHPATWVSGADNINQMLRWDSAKKTLFADVTYSTRAYADNTHPAEENNFSLMFPNVRLDSTSALTVEGRTIGHLRHGIFGSSVVLDKDVELDIHRHHGRVFAAINPATAE